MKLFTYGTLMPDGERAIHLGDTSQALGPDEVEGFLYDFGRWPGAMFMNGDSTVKGVVWDIEEHLVPDVLQVLDFLEGVDSGLFARVEVQTKNHGAAIAYQVSSNLVKETRPKLIENGEWKK